MSRTPQETKEGETEFVKQLATYPTKAAALAVSKRYSSLNVTFAQIGFEIEGSGLSVATVEHALERARGAVESLTMLRAQLD